MLSVRRLVAVGDALVRRKAPLATMDDLARASLSTTRMRGIVSIRRAVALVRPGTESPAETELRLIVVGAGLPEPVIGHEVFHGARFVGTPDLAYVDERVALEYEGDGHRTDQKTFRYEIERKERFHDAGWRTIRVTAEHLRRPSQLVQRIRAALQSR
jgi:hypothetical protein